MSAMKCEKSKYNLRNKKKVVESSSSDSESDSDFETISTSDSEDDSEEDDDDEEEEEEEEEEENVVVSTSKKEKKFDRKEFQKTLNDLFPSKYQKNKMTLAKSSKDTEEGEIEEDYDEGEESEEDVKEKKKMTKKDKKMTRMDARNIIKKSNTNDKKNDKDKKKKTSKKDKKSRDDDDEDEYDEECYEIDDHQGNGNINIIFEMDDARNMQEYNDWFGGEDEEEFVENENEECNSEDEENFMKEKYEKLETPSKKKKVKKEKTIVVDVKEDVEDEYLELQDLKKHLIQQYQGKPGSKILRNAIKECNDSIKKLVKKARSKNTKEYHKMITGQAQKFTNEIDYFKKKLSNKEQLKLMKDLKEINDVIHIEKPYRVALLESKIPAKYKANVMQKLNMLKHMEPGDNEYYKIKNWIDTFMRIPFGTNKNFEIKIEDGIDKCHDFMDNAMNVLNECVYGLSDAKMQILQMIGQWIANPGAMGTAIAIKGPPGTGKTSLTKDGISKILGREFTFIALGGAGDSSFLEGHSYTYEGSSWGKIVQILIDSKCMNPVIYFDELDKVSDTPRGQEIIGLLTHLSKPRDTMRKRN